MAGIATLGLSAGDAAAHAYATESCTSRSASWPGFAFLKSGIDPVLVGVVIGLLAIAYPAGARRPRARHRPVPPVPRAAHLRACAIRANGRRTALSPNERLQQHLSPGLELPDRAAVRARQRGYPDQRKLPGDRPTGRRSHSESSSATWSGSRSGSAARPRGGQAQPGPDPAPRRMGLGARRRRRSRGSGSRSRS